VTEVVMMNVKYDDALKQWRVDDHSALDRLDAVTHDRIGKAIRHQRVASLIPATGSMPALDGCNVIKYMELQHNKRTCAKT
jgi:hypothetical protein